MQSSEIKRKCRLALISLLLLLLCGCSKQDDGKAVSSVDLFSRYDDLLKTDSMSCQIQYYKDTYSPVDYSGCGYEIINSNMPTFSDDELCLKVRPYYSKLDDLGRSGEAFYIVSSDTLPQVDRGSIGMIKPSGWDTVRYDDLIPDKYLYNRCHLIGYQLGGADIVENLITGTRHLNIGIMLDIENKIADCVKNNTIHVLYKVKPIFMDENLVAVGVHIQAYSIEDLGESIKYNVFAYNIQPGIEIDYSDGKSHEVSN